MAKYGMNTIHWLLACGILACGACPTKTTASESQQPNILFILADDLGARDLSNEGSVFCESPNID